VKLFEPLVINGMRLENRIVVPAMVTRLSGEDGFVNQPIRDRYLAYASGEPGLIVVEAMAVHSAKSGPLLRISDDGFISGLRDLVQRIHNAGSSKVAPQIIHFLKVARSGWRQRIEDLSGYEIKKIVQLYGTAAGRAVKAGFDAVELHMAHAYTLSSFLSALNKRRDGYGGQTLESRMRLMGEVIVRVRQEVGKEFPIGVRFLGEECIKGGYTIEDSKEIALRMAQLGVDWISVSAGGKFEDAIKKEGEPLYPYTGYSGDRCMPPASYPDGANTYMAKAIKRYLGEHGLFTPVVTTGKIRTAVHAEEILQSGKADLIGMARALLADPLLPKKIKEGREETVVRCVYGNICKSLDENFKTVTCTLWPKGKTQAPVSYDRTPPSWPEGEAHLRGRQEGDKIRLEWKSAQDNEGVYGYEVFRATGSGPMLHHTSVRGVTPYYVDARVLGGNSYTYCVKAYDFAGNRSPASNRITVTVPSVIPAFGVE
jgi:2,4-dienoyl-CoA reductase-like NADH-dependent reductase (Old Yellow Enzyme family)